METKVEPHTSAAKPISPASPVHKTVSLEQCVSAFQRLIFQDNARLLAPALHMSHLNSPTDTQFREIPLSPMRRLRAGSTTPSPLASPTQMSDDVIEKSRRKPGSLQLSLKRITARIPDRKGFTGSDCGIVETNDQDQESKTAESTAVPTTSVSVRGGHVQTGGKGFQELQVHVETVD